MPNGRGRFAQFAFILTLAVFISELGSAQSSYQPSPENLQVRREFQDMKFGMFIHWGVYSVLGDGERSNALTASYSMTALVRCLRRTNS